MPVLYHNYKQLGNVVEYSEQTDGKEFNGLGTSEKKQFVWTLFYNETDSSRGRKTVSIRKFSANEESTASSGSVSSKKSTSVETKRTCKDRTYKDRVHTKHLINSIPSKKERETLLKYYSKLSERCSPNTPKNKQTPLPLPK